ncbi:DUF1304 domain-containing protein, partial [Cronobacter sakazakii]|uniref:DUF1304 domain-containing protein n=1 Tax=Cronobacter sakazakii TaxID=28141 RepID=UPI0021AB5805
MYLETIVPTSETTSRVFKMDRQELQRKSVTTLFKNQGIYNGLIGAGLIYSVYVAQATLEQSHINILVGYSSISHLGYLLVALIALKSGDMSM